MPHRRRRRSALIGLVAICMVLLQALPAYAWKPYTHNVTGQTALEDALDGSVTINGRSYSLRPEVAQALAAWPAYYNAGVIGPDGYPDLTFGQSVIHPEETGKWLRHIYEQAWAAQSDPSYSPAQRQQVLAFAYGYMTHATGDMWAHTLINAYTDGVFPAVKEILSEQEKLEIALRHILIEGYIGDATPGFDGNPNRTVLPYTNKETGQPDVSDDSTPPRDFAVPTRFVFETLVNPNNATPVNVCGNGIDEDRDGVADDGCPGGPPARNPGGGHEDGVEDGVHGSPLDGAEVKRGPLIDFFTVEKSKLQVARAKYQRDRGHVDCANGLDPDCYSLPEEMDECIEADPDCANESPTVTVHTVRGDIEFVWDRNVCYGATTGLCAPDPGDAIDTAVDALAAEYLEHWIADIDDGLAHWPEVGQAMTEAMFDPQARRDAQNFECRNYGADTTAAPEDNIRSKCEEGITVVDTALYKLDPYITNHLLSMLGLPDVTGDAIELLDEVAEVLDDVLGPAGNPLRMAKQELREYAKKLIYQEINDRYGIDVEAAQPFLMHPSTWFTSNAPIKIKAKPVLDGNGLPVWEKNAEGEWRPQLEVTELNLFTNDQHQRIDALLGLHPNHHVPITAGPQPPSETFPEGLPQATRLADTAEFNPSEVAPLRNTTMMAKLLLLDGGELNRALGEQLVADGYLKQAATVKTYNAAQSAHANIMLDGLVPGAAATTASREHTWLKSIDSDHAWRRDGLPTFCDAVPNDATPDPNDMKCATSAPNAIQPNNQPTLRAAIHGEYENGGHGNFPVWESCLLRPAFGSLFRDWENGSQQFPAHGDLASPDAADPNAPTSALTVGGNVKTIGSTVYLSGNHSFTVKAADAVFADSQLGVRYRFYKDGQQPGAWQPLANNGTFQIPAGAGDGLWRVETQASDPCHPFEGTGAMAPEPANVATFYLDTTPPQVTWTTPSQDAVYLLNESKPAAYSCSDGSGSGVTSCVGTVPVGTPISTAPVGVKSFTVNTTDELGNAASPTVSYKVTYKINVLYDQTKSHKAGSVVPIKLQLADANNVNQSAATIVVKASSPVKKDNSASTSVVDDAGNANPDSNFRFDPQTSAYIFNLKTQGMTTGTWALTFTATGDPVPHTVYFDIR